METYWQACVKKLLFLLLATPDYVRGNFSLNSCQFGTYNEHDIHFKRKFTKKKKKNDRLNFATLQAELLISQDSVLSPHTPHTTMCYCPNLPHYISLAGIPLWMLATDLPWCCSSSLLWQLNISLSTLIINVCFSEYAMWESNTYMGPHAAFIWMRNGWYKYRLKVLWVKDTIGMRDQARLRAVTQTPCVPEGEISDPMHTLFIFL